MAFNYFSCWRCLLPLLALCLGFSKGLTAQTLTFQDWSEYPNFFITVEYQSYSEQQNLVTIRVEKHVYPPRWDGATYSFGVYQGATTIANTTNSSSFVTSISPDVEYQIAVSTLAMGNNYASTSFSFSSDGSSTKWIEISESYTNSSDQTQQIRFTVSQRGEPIEMVIADVLPGDTWSYIGSVPENSIWSLEQAYTFDGVKGWAQIAVDYDLSGTGGGVPTGTDGAQAQYLTSVINQQTGELTNKFEDVATRLEAELAGVSALQNSGNLHLGEIVQGVDGILAIVDDIQGDYVYLSQIAGHTGNTSSKLDDVITELQGLEVSIDGEGIEIDNSELVGLLSNDQTLVVPTLNDDVPADVPVIEADSATVAKVSQTGVLLDTFTGNLTSIESTTFWSITEKVYSMTLPFPPLDTSFDLDVSFMSNQIELIRELIAWFIYLLAFFLFANIISRAFV